MHHRLEEIDALEEIQMDALDRTKEIQACRKEIYDQKLPKETGVTEGSLVLLFDSRHLDFLSKLHIWWMGPFGVRKVYSNGSLQLEDLDGNLQDTRVNRSRVKLYELESVPGDAHG